MNKLLDLAKRRKSIRNYKEDDNIELEKILYALRVALEAPSGRNCQPWQFLIIRDKETKKIVRSICEAAEKEFHMKINNEFKEWLKKRGITWRKTFLTQAPYLILVYSNKECPYSIQSTWIAIGYLILALEEQGLASLTYTPSKTIEINKALNVPKKYRLETIIPIGYPAKEKEKEPRMKPSEKIFIDEWGNPLKQ